MDKKLLNDALLQSEFSISMSFMCAYVAMEIMTAIYLIQIVEFQHQKNKNIFVSMSVNY